MPELNRRKRGTALRRGLQWAGSTLCLAGVLFVTLRFYEYGAQISIAHFNAFAWIVLAGFVLVYGAANVLLALAWWDLLGFFGAVTTRAWAVRAYGLSQLAKYVPGNIFHLAGRQAFGLAARLPGWPLAKSSLWELGLMSVTGALFVPLLAPLIARTNSAPWTWATFTTILAIAVGSAWRWFGAPVARAVGLYALFLAVSGFVFVGVLALIAPQGGLDLGLLPALCGAYVVAWLIGLVTPGAPAGVGVRELVLLFLLGSFISEAESLQAVVLARVVTVAGDVLYFAVAFIMRIEKKSRANNQ